MPPNRKGNFDAVDTALLNVSQFVETAKFQPLTAAAPATTQSNDAPVVVKAVEQQQQHYDDPAKQAIIDRVLLEERLREQFSVDHIIQAEQQQHEARDKADVHTEDTKSDDYWAMTTPTDLSDEVRSKQTNASYWDWPTQTKQQAKDDLVSAILEQERVRQLFTVDHMLVKIKEQASTLQQETLPQNDGYWEWDGKVDLNDNAMEADKDEIIQHILEAEKLRRQFSVAALEEKLIQEQKVSEEAISHTAAANDDYWAGF